MAKIVIAGGNKYYLNDSGKAHREDGPATIWKSGGYSYEVNGQPYREGGLPTDYDSNGLYSWWVDDSEPHRSNGPAYDWPNGYKIWFKGDRQQWPEL